MELLEQAIQEVRTIFCLLYPPMLKELGLNGAIAWYLEGFRQRSSITTTFAADSNLERLSREVELALFSVLQGASQTCMAFGQFDREHQVGI
jgi:signal transduction histidine kinase